MSPGHSAPRRFARWLTAWITFSVLVVLREEWDSLAKQHPDRFKAVYTLDNPPFMLWKGERHATRHLNVKVG